MKTKGILEPEGKVCIYQRVGENAPERVLELYAKAGGMIVKMACYCGPKGREERLKRYLVYYRENEMDNLEADWFYSAEELKRGMKAGGYDMVLMSRELMQVGYGEFSKILDSLWNGLEQEEGMYSWSLGGRYVLMREGEITHLYSEQRKTYVSDGKSDYQIRGQLNEEEKRLPAERFVRIHRNCLVNLAQIRAVDGTYVILRNGRKLEMSIRRRGETVGKLKAYLSKYVDNESAKSTCESTRKLENHQEP